MKTLQEIYDRFKSELQEVYEIKEIQWLFFLFLQHLERVEKTKFFLAPDTPVQSTKWDEVIFRLKNEEPWQYIIGETEFYGLKIKLNQHVLIPRPETEYLVEIIHKDLKKTPPGIIWDLGAGSGCIALALAQLFPDTRVIAQDYKEEALEVVQQNAGYNKIKNVEIFKGDVLKKEFPSVQPDLIVSNPPYISLSETIIMKRNVLDYEPHDALFVPEDDPVIFYKLIIDYFIENTLSHTRLYFEINPRFVTELDVFIKSKKLAFEFLKDLSGIKRFVRIEKQNIIK